MPHSYAWHDSFKVGGTQAAQEWTNRTLAVHELTSVHFLVLPGSLLSITEITEYRYFSPYKPIRELTIKVSKILNQWSLLLKPFCFCETEYLHFTTRVFGHSAISPFLGGIRIGDFLRIMRIIRIDKIFNSIFWKNLQIFTCPQVFRILDKFMGNKCMYGFYTTERPG